MLLALSQMHVVGVGQNIAFLSRLIDHPLFRSGQVDTGLIEREREVLLPPQVEVPQAAFEVAALACIARDAERSEAQDDSPWEIAEGVRVTGTQLRTTRIMAGHPGCGVPFGHETTSHPLSEEDGGGE